jgi:pimeloyl-ACP methyl ester carboxylesterase
MNAKWPWLLGAVLGVGGLCAWAEPDREVRPDRSHSEETLPSSWQVEVPTEDGWLLQGSYHPPEAPSASGIVLLHMRGRDRADWDPIIPLLHRRGLGVLAIDLRGHGKSLLHHKEPRFFFQMDLQEEKNRRLDLAGALEFLRRRPEIDRGRLFVAGASMGANVALDHASEHPEDIRGLLLFSPRWNIAGIDVREKIDRCKKLPALVLAGAEESFLSEIQELQHLLESSRLVLLPDRLGLEEGHGTSLLVSARNAEPIRRAIEEWLGEITSPAGKEGR